MKQETFAETFYTKFDKLDMILSCSGIEADERNSPKRATSYWSDKRYARNVGKTATSGNIRDVRGRAEPRCYECDGREHFARECPTRLKRRQTQNSPRRKYPRGRSSRPCSPGDKPLYANVQGGNIQPKNQGNE